MRWCGFTVAVLLYTTAAAPGADKSDPKSPLPGNAAWNVTAFNVLFRVVDTTYDEKTSTVRWTLATKDDYRTADFVREVDKDRPFVFVFADGEMNELATVRLGIADFKGVPKEKVIPKGTPLQVTLEVPNVLAKTKTVVLRRGKE
jgi:hypothetical protein